MHHTNDFNDLDFQRLVPVIITVLATNKISWEGSAMGKTLEKIDRIIIKINGVILVTAITLMFIFVFGNVIGRYFFHITYYWTDELSRYLMISLAFLGMGLAMRQGSHSSFNILQNILSDKQRRLLRIIVLVITFAFMALFCYLGLLYSIRNMNNRTEALRWRNGLWYLMIPAGGLLFIWHTLMISRQYVNQSRKADIEREIAAGDELVKDSEFLKQIDFNEKIDTEKN